MTGIVAASGFVPSFVNGGETGVVAIGDTDVFGTGRAEWGVKADGFSYRNGVKSFAWINPQLGMDAFEIRATLAGGSDPLQINSGAGWLSPLANPSWGYAAFTHLHGTLTVEIRRKSDSVVVDTATIDLEIEGVTDGGGGTGPGAGGGGTPVFPPIPRDRDTDLAN